MEGLLLGLDDGDFEGDRVGLNEGFTVGFEGIEDGKAVGLVGVEEGDEVGEVGIADGDLDGRTLEGLDVPPIMSTKTAPFVAS